MNLVDIDDSHNLYLIRVYGVNTSFVKLGYSSSIKSRLNQYYSHNPLFELIGTYYRKDAKSFESKLHKNVESIVMREWYQEKHLITILYLIENGIPNRIKKK
jgi:hypothetical protein